MPSGHKQRTSFPEMVARLRSRWREALSMPALIGLRDQLDRTLLRIRVGQNILPIDKETDRSPDRETGNSSCFAGPFALQNKRIKEEPCHVLRRSVLSAGRSVSTASRSVSVS